MLKIIVAGATGWVGRDLIAEILSSNDLMLAGAIARKGAGKDIASYLGMDECGVVISDALSDELAASADVLIDYTAAAVARENCKVALKNACAVVIGTSGLQSDDFAAIDASAREYGVGVIAAGNFSVTAVLMKRFALEAARYLNDVEIVEYASPGKKDTPSGTSLELADALSAVRRPGTSLAVDALEGFRTTRGAALGREEPVQVHSVRLPSYSLSVETLFAADDERLSIRHDAGSSARPYVMGTLLATRHVIKISGLIRGIETLM
ncbi:4-hydroxy-tetrahydrodipicolinate reductase (plasmid) [Pantoea sp. JZ29]|uniref:4-hydroxy-tetrahydrodipicolinate reductase n=1 Tax=Pantoea sp. JZ29 TaxID=2654192 RepID=UPI002B482BAC|nr:4-hydroxy-tetrahydrodipicolinate reductase [Pantoea sp. JZ29]WRH23331.1 4-hydroxy-tetrahydrodipicolinate reductase [Pantoea sp. JZ29]